MGVLAPPSHQITLYFLHPLDLPADCLAACEMDSASKAKVGSDSVSSSERELNDVYSLPSGFQGMSHYPSMRVPNRHLVPMTRLFSTSFLSPRGIRGISSILFKGGTFPQTYSLTVRTSKGWKEAPLLRIIIAWQRAVGGGLQTRSPPTVTSMHSISLQVSFALG